MNNQKVFLEKFDLTGRNALITGGAGLLGTEHARAILYANGNVILWDLDSEQLSQTSSKLKSEFGDNRITIEVIDVTEESQIENGIGSLIKNDIEIDILINNVAANPKYSKNVSSSDFSRLENFRLDDWNKEISIGLTSAFLCSKIIGTRMAKRRKGIILNIASDLSVIAPDQRLYKVATLEPELQPVKPVLPD